ncbi:MAG: hypothetical protein JNL90_11770 [Planctomycetes bacterium]|nr:hypothetical protein [Planctomycetota bacterium]
MSALRNALLLAAVTITVAAPAAPATPATSATMARASAVLQEAAPTGAATIDSAPTDAVALVERVRQRYGECERAELIVAADLRTHEGDELRERVEQSLTIRFERGGRLFVALDSRDGESEEGKFVAVDRGDGAPDALQRWAGHRSQPQVCADLDDALDAGDPELPRALLELLEPGGGDVPPGRPTPMLLLAGTPRSAVAEVQWDGRSVQRLQLEQPHRAVTLWIDPQDAAVRHCEIVEARRDRDWPDHLLLQIETRFDRTFDASHFALVAPPPERRQWPAGWIDNSWWVVLLAYCCLMSVKEWRRWFRRRVELLPAARARDLVWPLVPMFLIFADDSLAALCLRLGDWRGSLGHDFWWGLGQPIVVVVVYVITTRWWWPRDHVSRVIVGLDDATTVRLLERTLEEQSIAVERVGPLTYLGPERTPWHVSASSGNTVELKAPTSDAPHLGEMAARVVARANEARLYRGPRFGWPSMLLYPLLVGVLVWTLL